MAEVVNSIASSASDRLAQQPPALPAAKKVVVPEVQVVAQLCCPPEMVLLEHFRVQRQQVVEVSALCVVWGVHACVLRRHGWRSV